VVRLCQTRPKFALETTEVKNGRPLKTAKPVAEGRWDLPYNVGVGMLQRHVELVGPGGRRRGFMVALLRAIGFEVLSCK
jgi:hypothetical protein